MRFPRFPSLALALLLSPAALLAEEEVAKIEIGTVHGTMRYDLEAFEVKPGQQVELTFSNTDEMQHNLVLIRPAEDGGLALAEKAWLLGADAVAMQYIPDDPAVMFHTRVLEPGETETLSFRAPDEVGDFPYVCTIPGHAHLMKGVMRVRSARAGLRDLSYALYQGRWTELPDFGALAPVARGRLEDGVVDLAVGNDFERHFGLVFSGILDVPEDGEYRFFLNSDDGSRLLVGEVPVVDFDGVHPASGFREGTLELERGPQPFRVLYFEFEGDRELELAWEGPGVARTALSRPLPPPVSEQRFRPQPSDAPLVIRAFVRGGPPRAISVGLPAGRHFTYDPDTLGVAMAWEGGFLDVGPDRGRDEGDRGGQWCAILGELFATGLEDGFPLRFGRADAPAPEARFEGYRRGVSSATCTTGCCGETPEFLISAGEIQVRHRVFAEPEGPGLRHEFLLDPSPGDVFLRFNPDLVEASSPVGELHSDGVLHVPAADSAAFRVTLHPR